MSKDLYLSYSGFFSYKRCSKKYRLSYIARRPRVIDPRTSMFGTAIGKIFEWFYSRQLWKSEDPLSACVSLIDESVDWTFNHEGFSVTSDQSYVRGLLADLRTYVPPGFNTIVSNSLLTEYSMAEVDLTNNLYIEELDCRIRIGGKCDFLHSSDGSNFSILDGKASAYREKYVDPDQLIWYALQFYVKYGKIPDKLGFIFWRFPDDPISWIDFDGGSVDRLFNDIKRTVQSIKEEKFDPHPSFGCKLCDYSSSCSEGQKQLAIISSEKSHVDSGVSLSIDEI